MYIRKRRNIKDFGSKQIFRFNCLRISVQYTKNKQNK